MRSIVISLYSIVSSAPYEGPQSHTVLERAGSRNCRRLGISFPGKPHTAQRRKAMSKLRKAAVTKRSNFRESVGDGYEEMEQRGYLQKKGEVRERASVSISLPVLIPMAVTGSGFGGSWQKRYFVASGHYLKYYKAEADSHKGKPPLAAIDLRKVEVPGWVYVGVPWLT